MKTFGYIAWGVFAAAALSWEGWIWTADPRWGLHAQVLGWIGIPLASIWILATLVNKVFIDMD